MKEDELQKAFFEVYVGNEASCSEKIPVLFNPSEYSISGGAQYISESDKSGTKNTQGVGKQNYAGSRPQILNVDLFFDTSGQMWVDGKSEQASDVSAVTKKFANLVRVKGEAHEPPVVCFCWGSLKFRGTVEDIRTTYVMFTEEGKPIRARMSLTIKEKPKSSEKYMEPFQSPDRTKARMITDDVDVWTIAKLEYGNPDMWRTICRANNIADPLHIPSGTMLKVPALD